MSFAPILLFAGYRRRMFGQQNADTSSRCHYEEITWMMNSDVRGFGVPQRLWPSPTRQPPSMIMRKPKRERKLAVTITHWPPRGPSRTDVVVRHAPPTLMWQTWVWASQRRSELDYGRKTPTLKMRPTEADGHAIQLVSQIGAGLRVARHRLHVQGGIVAYHRQ